MNRIFIVLLFFSSSLPQMFAQKTVEDLSQIWKDVSNNYWNPEYLKEINWDSIYYSHLNNAHKVKTFKEHYMTLQSFLAKLNDGHTELWDYSSLLLRDSSVAGLFFGPYWLGEKAYVGHVEDSLSNVIPLGSEILSIDGKDVNTYFEESVFPYVCARTIQHKRSLSTGFVGNKGDSIRFVYKTLSGEVRSSSFVYSLTRTTKRGKRIKSLPVFNREFSSWKSDSTLDGNFYYLRLDEFGNKSISGIMQDAMPMIKESDYMILDLRYNRGGNENKADSLLMYFLNTDTLRTYKSITRSHNARLAAKGYGNRRFRDYYDNCHLDTLRESVFVKRHTISIDIPLFVLISDFTISAAEDLLITMKLVDPSKFVFVGMPTAGSTGAPLVRRLHDGGSYRICTRWPLTPVGLFEQGIQPDYYYEPTIEDVVNRKDRIFEFVHQLYKKTYNYEK